MDAPPIPFPVTTIPTTSPSRLPPFATAPYINLSAQKDRHHLKENQAAFLAGMEVIGGTQAAAGAREEIALVSDLIYYALTTGRGKQTLGEEYCDLYAMLGDNRRRPSRARRGLLALALALMPYLQARMRTGLASFFALFAREQETAQQRANRLRARMRASAAMLSPDSPSRLSRGNDNDSTSDEEGESKGLEEHAVAIALRRWYGLATAYLASRREMLMEMFSSLHLGWFYMHGDFADLPHRLLGVRSVFPRAPATQQPNYYLLGVFIFVQYGVEGLRFVYGKLFPAVSSSSTSSGSNAVSSESNKPRTVVPSLPAASGTTTTSGRSGEDERAKIKGGGGGDADFEFDEWMGTCGVCLSSLEHAATPPCGHVFCYACILEASISKRECPICRQECTPQSVRCIYSFAKRVV